jgi:hypothetical protein
LKYAKLFFTTLSLEETFAPALIIEVLQNSSSLLLLLKILTALINLLDLFLDVTNIQPKPEKSSRNLLMHLVTCTFSLPKTFAYNLVDLHFHQFHI